MVTRAKPFVVDTKPVKQTRGRSLGSAKIAERAIRQYEQTINSLFGPEDYEAITTKVPLKPGADKVKLQLGIKRAAVWYAIRAEMPKKMRLDNKQRSIIWPRILTEFAFLSMRCTASSKHFRQNSGSCCMRSTILMDQSTGAIGMPGVHP
jgi:hypothetical protein